MEKIYKTHLQVASQMERWLINDTEKRYDGSESFTLYSCLFYEKQNRLYKLMDLPPEEIPVFCLFVKEQGHIITTTQRFIKVNDAGTESIFFNEFAGHAGFKFETRGYNVSGDGRPEFCQIRLVDKRPVFWMIPSGLAGYAFLRVTNRCEIIGRRYIVRNQ